MTVSNNLIKKGQPPETVYDTIKLHDYTIGDWGVTASTTVMESAKNLKSGKTRSTCQKIWLKRLEDRIQKRLLAILKEDIDETIYRALDNAIHSGVGLGTATPSHIPMAPARPAGVQANNPVTNLSYRQVFLPSELAELIVLPTYPHLKSEIINVGEVILEDKIELFVGKLRYARYHQEIGEHKEIPDWLQDGHTYDPWYRDISELKDTRYVRGNTQRFAAQTGINHTKQLMLWPLATTVEGTKIRLLLYDILEVGYTDSITTNWFMDSIDPYTIKTTTSYNLSS